MKDRIRNRINEAHLEWAVSVLVFLFLALHLMASFLPTGRTWGFHHWFFFPLPFRSLLIVGAVLCIPQVNRSVVGCIKPFAEQLSIKISRLNKYTIAIALGVVFFVVFYLLRSRTHFLGDGYLLLRTLEGGNTFMPAKPLDSFIHYLVYSLTRSSLGWSAETVYAVVSCAAGSIFIFLLVMFSASFDTDRWKGIIMFVAVLLMGSVQLFFGYVESYSLLLLELLIYVFFALSYLNGKTSIFIPSCVLSIMICTHISAIVFLPTLFFLALAKVKNCRAWNPIIQQFSTMLIGIVIPLVVIMVLMGLFGISFSMLITELTRESHILPLIDTFSGDDSFQYGILSLTHFVDLFNEMILVAPTVFLLIIPMLFFVPWRNSQHDRKKIFLLTMSVMCFIYLLVIKPDLGASRDWDLFAIAGLPWTLLCVYHVVNLPVHSERLLGIGSVVIIVVTLHTIPWILVNSDTNRSVERFQVLVERDSTWDLKATGAAYDELRSYYYERGMEDRHTYYAKKAAEWISNPRHILNLGISFIDQGQYSEALEALEKIGDGSVHAPLAYFNRGNAYLYLNELENAIEAYQHSLQRAPQQADTYSNLGIAYYRLNRIDEAIFAFRKALEMNPEYTDAHFNLGMIYYGQGKLQEAIDEFQKTIRIEPHHKEAHSKLADIHLEQGRTLEAISEYRKVIEIDPDFIGAHFELGTIYLKQGRLQEAISEFMRVLEIQPEHADSHFKLGNIYLERKRMREAVSAYNKAIEINPDHFEAHTNLGIAYFHLGQEAEALSEFRRAIQINPIHPNGYLNLGNIYVKQGKFEEAISEYQNVLKINPNNLNARCNLGIAYLQLGNIEAAVSEFQGILEEDPQHETARRLLQRAQHRGQK